MRDDDLTPTEPIDYSLVRAARPENDDDITKRECPRCIGLGARKIDVGGKMIFERVDCSLCDGAGWVSIETAKAYELHLEMTKIVSPQ